MLSPYQGFFAPKRVTSVDIDCDMSKPQCSLFAFNKLRASKKTTGMNQSIQKGGTQRHDS